MTSANFKSPRSIERQFDHYQFEGPDDFSHFNGPSSVSFDLVCHGAQGVLDSGRVAVEEIGDLAQAHWGAALDQEHGQPAGPDDAPLAAMAIQVAQ